MKPRQVFPILAVSMVICLAWSASGQSEQTPALPFELLVAKADAVMVAKLVERDGTRLTWQAVDVIKGDLSAPATFAMELPPDLDPVPEALTASPSLAFLVLERCVGTKSGVPFLFPTLPGAMVPLHRSKEIPLLYPWEPCTEVWPMKDPTTFREASDLARRLVAGVETQDLLLLALARQAACADMLPPKVDPTRNVADASLCQSYAWFALEGVLKHQSGAEIELGNLRSRMSPTELFQGKKLAAEYLRKIGPVLDDVAICGDVLKIADAFAKGDIVARDEVEAYAWYSQLRGAGYEPDLEAANAILPGMAERLGKERLLEAQVRAGIIRKAIDFPGGRGLEPGSTGLGAQVGKVRRTYGLLEKHPGNSNILDIPWESLKDCDWLSLFPIMTGNGSNPDGLRGEPIKTTIRAWFGETPVTVFDTDGGEIPMEPVRVTITELARGEPSRLSLSLGGASPVPPPLNGPTDSTDGTDGTWRFVVAEGRKPYVPGKVMMLAVDGSGKPTSRIIRGERMLKPHESICIEVFAGTLKNWTIKGETRSYPRKEAVFYHGKDPSVPTESLLERARSLLGTDDAFTFEILVNVEDPPQPGKPCVAFIYQLPTGEVGVSPLKFYPNSPVEPIIAGPERRSSRAHTTSAGPGSKPTQENGDGGRRRWGMIVKNQGGTGHSCTIRLGPLLENDFLRIVPEFGEFRELVVEGKSGLERREILRTASLTVELDMVRKKQAEFGLGDDCEVLFDINPRPLRFENGFPVFEAAQVNLKLDKVASQAPPASRGGSATLTEGLEKAMAPPAPLAEANPKPEAPLPPHTGILLANDGCGFAQCNMMDFQTLRPDDVFGYKVTSGTFLYWHFQANGNGKDGGLRTIYKGCDNSLTVADLRKKAEEAGLSAPRKLFLLVNGAMGHAEPAACTIYNYRITGHQPSPASQAAAGRKIAASTGIPQLEEFAGNGDLEAMFKLGCAYLRGEGVPRDVGTGIGHLTKAAEGGLRRAQARLGDAYFSGEVNPREAEKAARWLSAAAMQGERGVWSSLGFLFEPPEPLEFPEFRVGSPWAFLYRELFLPNRLEEPRLVEDAAQSVENVLDQMMGSQPGLESLVANLADLGNPRAVKLILKRLRDSPASFRSRWIPHIRVASGFGPCRELIEQARTSGLNLSELDDR